MLVAEDERFMPPILEQGARFVRRLREVGVPADLKVVPGTHMTSIADLAGAGSEALRAVLAFIRNPQGAAVR